MLKGRGRERGIKRKGKRVNMWGNHGIENRVP